jgi:hypothetical protein
VEGIEQLLAERKHRLLGRGHFLQSFASERFQLCQRHCVVRPFRRTEEVGRQVTGCLHHRSRVSHASADEPLSPCLNDFQLGRGQLNRQSDHGNTR